MKSTIVTIENILNFEYCTDARREKDVKRLCIIYVELQLHRFERS